MQRTTLTLAWLDKTLAPPPVLVAVEPVFFVQLARLATRSRVQPVALTCPVPSVGFSAEDARRPFLTANHGMWSFFEPALRKRLHDLDRQATMTERGSFQKTLDQVRKSLAQHYLEHSAMTGAEISFLLGFEDPNSFVRAFQAWTGTTPQSVRTARSGRAS